LLVHFSPSLLFSEWIIELNASPFPEINEVIRLRLNNLLNITSSIILNDGTNEENLRICLPCAQFLQKNYDIIRFRNIEKDVLFQHYEVNDVEKYLFNQIFFFVLENRSSTK
jgi:hypothetical protein